MPEYLTSKFMPTSPPPGTISVMAKHLKAGDQIWGARYVGIKTWTFWAGTMLKSQPKEFSAAVILLLDHPDGRAVEYDYPIDMEFLVIRPDSIGSDDRYPHKCPRCGGHAYINIFNAVDCKARCSS